MMKKEIPRSAEIDILRCAAILMMMAYHLAYDLQVFYGWGIVNIFGLGWTTLERVTASLFLSLTGLCFMISWQRSTSTIKYLRRGVKILCYGFVVSIATYIVDPDSFVRFGILHLIGVATIILPLFIRFGRLNLLIGIGVIMMSLLIPSMMTETSMLLPLGLRPFGFQSVDYFPFIPWFGVILIGVSMGHIVVRSPERYTFISPINKDSALPLRILRTISAHSLEIYMVHQPVLLGILWLIRAHL